MRAFSEMTARTASLFRTHFWWLALPFLIDLTQRITEIRAGLFDGTIDDPNFYHLLFGPVKVYSMFLMIAVACRFWVLGARVTNAGAFLSTALRAALVFAGHVGTLVFMLKIAEELFSALGTPNYMGFPVVAIIAAALVWVPLHCMLIPWYVSFMCGDCGLKLTHSARGVLPRLGAAIGLFVLGFVPFNVVHGVLELGLIGKPAALVWPVMVTVDPLVVTIIAAYMAASYQMSYERARELSGEPPVTA